MPVTQAASRRARRPSRKPAKAKRPLLAGFLDPKKCRMCLAIEEAKRLEEWFEDWEEQMPGFEFMVPTPQGLIDGDKIRISLDHDLELDPARCHFLSQILEAIEPMIKDLAKARRFILTTFKKAGPDETPKAKAKRLAGIRRQRRREFESRVKRERKSLEKDAVSPVSALSAKWDREHRTLYGRPAGSSSKSLAGK